MTLSELAENLKASIPKASAKLCENCHVFFNYKNARFGFCPFCGSEATEFYETYIRRLRGHIEKLTVLAQSR